MIESSKAWTGRYGRRVLALELKVGVSAPYTGQQPEGMVLKRANMIWDTGATGSVITPAIAHELGLRPIDQKMVHAAGTQGMKNVYLVNLHLPNNHTIESIRVTEADLTSPGLEGLIGMDVISHGDFCVTHASGDTVVTFRIPSCGEVDYVKEKRQSVASKANPKPKEDEPQQMAD